MVGTRAKRKRKIVAVDISQEEEEGELVILLTAVLPDLDAGINSNNALHAFETINTRIHSCNLYKRRLLTFAMPVHHHEVHKVHCQDDDENVFA